MTLGFGGNLRPLVIFIQTQASLLLILNQNPKPKCSTCRKTVRLSTATKCVNCGDSFHKKCARLIPGSHNEMTWNCSSCVRYFDSFPFALMDVMDHNNDISNHSLNVQYNDPLSEFSMRFLRNLKLGHLN